MDIHSQYCPNIQPVINIGMSNNKLLAKVASDFKKPDMIHTLFPHEIEKKMWPFPVEDVATSGRGFVYGG
jgi:DNA polymerase-4